MLLIGFPAFLVSCGDSTSPSGLSPAGSYHAAVFVTTRTTGQRDEIQAGSTLNIILAENGITSGHLHVSGTGGGPPFDADLGGTWTRNGDVVDFIQPVDTFVDDMLFTFALGANGYFTLTGDQVFTGTRIQIVLTQGP